MGDGEAYGSVGEGGSSTDDGTVFGRGGGEVGAFGDAPVDVGDEDVSGRGEGEVSGVECGDRVEAGKEGMVLTPWVEVDVAKAGWTAVS